MQDQGPGRAPGVGEDKIFRNGSDSQKEKTGVGDRQRRLNRWIQAFDDQRRALLDELAALPPEELRAKARPDKWSILEIVEHLVLAERFVLAGMPPAAELVARRRSLKNRCIYPIVLFVLKFSIPVKVPAKRMLPTGQASLADVRSAWDENLRWLRGYVAGVRGGGPRPGRRARRRVPAPGGGADHPDPGAAHGPAALRGSSAADPQAAGSGAGVRSEASS